MQLEAISSCPITSYLGKETKTHLNTISFQAAVESNKVPPQPPLLHTKQPHFPQPLLSRLLLQTLPQPRCPSLDTLQHLNVLLVVRGPKLHTALKVQSHQCIVQGHDPCPAPAGHTIPETSQDASHLLGHLAHCWVMFSRLSTSTPRSFSARQPSSHSSTCLLHAVVVMELWDPALGLVAPHKTGLGPSIQPVQIPLQSLPILEQIDTPAQFGVICKLTEGALNPLIQITDKGVKQDWPQNWVLGSTTLYEERAEHLHRDNDHDSDDVW